MKDKTGWNKYRHKRRTTEPRETQLLIESLTNSGDGLGRLDQRVVFVPYTLPGDRVRIRITQQKKTYALAETQELLEPGASRITPRCAHFGVCGGCDWQHVPYQEQLDAKRQQLQETLTRIGSLDAVTVEPVVHADAPYQYRNRIQGELRSGTFHYKRRRSDQRVAISRCEIAEEPINDWLATRIDASLSGKVEVALVDDEVVVVPVNEKNSTELGFRQVNSAVSTLLTQRLMSLVTASDCRQVLDLYCGKGGWTQAIASEHPDKQVLGIDSSEDNILAAQYNARLAKLKNLHYKHSTVEKSLASLTLQESLCIVDPPRAGLDASVIDALTAQRCRSLIYVSCHPATLARDLKLLTHTGYRIEQLVPLDMFPQTAHLECLVHLVSNN